MSDNIAARVTDGVWSNTIDGLDAVRQPDDQQCTPVFAEGSKMKYLSLHLFWQRQY